MFRGAVSAPLPSPAEGVRAVEQQQVQMQGEGEDVAAAGPDGAGQRGGQLQLGGRAGVPPGDARDILEELNWGVIADPDVEQIGQAIERLIELPAPDRRADPEGRYDRAILAGRLADTLSAASGDGRDGVGAPSAR